MMSKMMLLKKKLIICDDVLVAYRRPVYVRLHCNQSPQRVSRTMPLSSVPRLPATSNLVMQKAHLGPHADTGIRGDHSRSAAITRCSAARLVFHANTHTPVRSRSIRSAETPTPAPLRLAAERCITICIDIADPLR
jgi:hypothetical protein